MNRRILTDTVSVGILTSVAKVAGAFKAVAVARYFGARDDLDAYLVAFLIPSFLGDVLAGALTQALLPILLEVREKRGRGEEVRLCSAILLLSAGALGATALAVAFGAEPLLKAIGSGFSPAKLALTRHLMFVMLPILPVCAANVTWRTLLNAREHFLAAAATPALTPLASITAVILFGREWGIQALAAGTTAGVFLEAIALCWATGATGKFLQLDFSGLRTEVRRAWEEYLPVAASAMILGGSVLVDQTMAAMLGSGSVSALNYGTRLNGVLLATGPAALATVVFPRLSMLATQAKWTDFRKIVRDFGLLSALATVPVTILLIFFSGPLVRLFFERGAFTAADSGLVARVQACALAQIPFSVLLTLLVRVVSSLKANHLLLPLAALSLLVNVGLNVVFMRWLGVAGIALSTTGVSAIGLAYMWFRVFRGAAFNSQKH